MLTRSQRSLKKWTEEDWGYSSPAMAARSKKNGIPARYLPKKAWSRLSPAQKAATNRKKLAGKVQFISNTKAAREASRYARK